MDTQRSARRRLALLAPWVRTSLAFLVAGAAAGAFPFLLRHSVGGAVAIAVVGIAALAMGGWWMTRRVLRLRRLEQATTLLADWALRYDSRNQAPTDHMGGVDEFAVLSAGVEDLARRLSQQVKETARKNRNLEALIDAMDEPVLATDSDDRVLLCNRSAEALLGSGAGGLIGRSFGDLFTQGEIVEMHAAAHAGETRRGKVRMTTALGVRAMQVSAAPVPVAWGQGIFGAVMVLRDVTELSQAVQVKTDFVANASHELRTPVAAIRGAAETLEEAMQDNPEMAQRLVRMITGHTHRLEGMLRDLLDLSRLESTEVPVKSESIDLGEIERAMRAQFEHACTPRGLTLRFDLDPALKGLRTDPGLLGLVVRNFIENAVKFAHDNTAIHVRASIVEEIIGNDAENSDESMTAAIVRIEVQDQGVGIPLQHQDRVFERYYQVDAARTGATGMKRGTGLGLAIVKHAAKALGGRVGLHSVWGEGTRVWAEWPVQIEGGAAPHRN